MHISTFGTALPALGVASLALLAGCGGISDMTREHVARSETAVMQAQQTVGNSEHGALELQSARDHLAEAKKAVDDKKDKPADRHAEQARLDAELAVAKSQTASARKAADELQASIRTLRQEAGVVNPNP
jgi:chromosome segregation ATPase